MLRALDPRDDRARPREPPLGRLRRVAYWYQELPHRPFEIPPAAVRLARSDRSRRGARCSASTSARRARRAVLARPDGEIVASRRPPHGAVAAAAGWAEHDAEAIWWGDFLSLCASCVGRASRRASRRSASAGIGPCLLAADAAGRPLRPPSSTASTRAPTREIEELTERSAPTRSCAAGGSAALHPGGRPEAALAAAQRARGLGAHAPAADGELVRMQRLTGEYVLDHHSASQCDPLYDLRRTAGRATGRSEIAPGLRAAARWSGRARSSARHGRRGRRRPACRPARRCAPARSTPGPRRSASGVRAPGDLMLMYGTTMFVIEVVDGALSDPRLWAHRRRLPGHAPSPAGMATSGALTGWLREHRRRHARTSAWSPRPPRRPPGADGLVALPYFAGERTPIYDPRRPRPDRRADHSPRARAPLPGAARGHGLRACATRSRSSTPPAAAPRRVVAVGGGTRRRPLAADRQRRHGHAQEVPAVTVGAAYGDALLAAQSAGLASLETVWARIVREVQPRDEPIYDELYTAYGALHEATVDCSTNSPPSAGALRSARRCSARASG